MVNEKHINFKTNEHSVYILDMTSIFFNRTATNKTFVT